MVQSVELTLLSFIPAGVAVSVHAASITGQGVIVVPFLSAGDAAVPKRLRQVHRTAGVADRTKQMVLQLHLQLSINTGVSSSGNGSNSGIGAAAPAEAILGIIRLAGTLTKLGTPGTAGRLRRDAIAGGACASDWSSALVLAVVRHLVASNVLPLKKIAHVVSSCDAATSTVAVEMGIVAESARTADTASGIPFPQAAELGSAVQALQKGGQSIASVNLCVSLCCMAVCVWGGVHLTVWCACLLGAVLVLRGPTLNPFSFFKTRSPLNTAAAFRFAAWLFPLGWLLANTDNSPPFNVSVFT